MFITSKPPPHGLTLINSLYISHVGSHGQPEEGSLLCLLYLFWDTFRAPDPVDFYLLFNSRSATSASLVSCLDTCVGSVGCAPRSYDTGQPPVTLLPHSNHRTIQCSCAPLFTNGGWGTPFTWAESGPDDSAIPWVSWFTHGLHYHTKELLILIEECVKCTICSI